jgi:hypothetical protein
VGETYKCGAIGAAVGHWGKSITIAPTSTTITIDTQIVRASTAFSWATNKCAVQ